MTALGEMAGAGSVAVQGFAIIEWHCGTGIVKYSMG